MRVFILLICFVVAATCTIGGRSCARRQAMGKQAKQVMAKLSDNQSLIGSGISQDFEHSSVSEGYSVFHFEANGIKYFVRFKKEGGSPNLGIIIEEPTRRRVSILDREADGNFDEARAVMGHGSRARPPAQAELTLNEAEDFYQTALSLILDRLNNR